MSLIQKLRNGSDGQGYESPLCLEAADAMELLEKKLRALISIWERCGNGELSALADAALNLQEVLDGEPVSGPWFDDFFQEEMKILNSSQEDTSGHLA